MLEGAENDISQDEVTAPLFRPVIREEFRIVVAFFKGFRWLPVIPERLLRIGEIRGDRPSGNSAFPVKDPVLGADLKFYLRFTVRRDPVCRKIVYLVG